MMINEIMEKRNLSKYRLSKNSGIPYTTLTDIISGKALHLMKETATRPLFSLVNKDTARHLNEEARRKLELDLAASIPICAIASSTTSWT